MLLTNYWLACFKLWRAPACLQPWREPGRRLFLLNQRDDANGLTGQGKWRVESQHVETCDIFTTHLRRRGPRSRGHGSENFSPGAISLPISLIIVRGRNNGLGDKSQLIATESGTRLLIRVVGSDLGQASFADSLCRV